MDVLSLRARSLFLLLLAVLPSLAGAAAGRTQGIYGVSPTGAARYSIPIWTPPGVMGIQPTLALSYSSEAGNGYYGYGWSLQGLSAITRCNKTWAQDGVAREVRNDAADRFCLDGNQLKLTSGTYGGGGAQYQPEVETFSRTTSYGAAGNGPAYFIVEGKNGLIFEYGNTTDSRIESVGQTTARTWALNKVRDRSGNTMILSYSEDTTEGSYRIASIQYTSNASAGVTAHYTVTFVPETIPTGEIDLSFRANSKINRVNWIDRIDVTHDGALVHRYDLTYESSLSITHKSRLASIQECAGAAPDCFPATTFTYQNGSVGLNSEVNTGYPMLFQSRPWALDVNGDGRRDLVYPSSITSGSGTWLVAFANSSGGYNTPTNTSNDNANWTGAIPIDYNADGREDLLVPYSGGTWWYMLGTATGLAAPVNTGAPATGAGYSARALDIDGDGLQDLVWADLVGYAGGDVMRYRLRLASGGFSSTVTNLTTPLDPDDMMSAPFSVPGEPARIRPPDFNGDGRADITYRITTRNFVDGPNTYNYSYRQGVICPGGFSFSVALTSSASEVYYGDFNGDGLTDLLYLKGGTTTAVRYSTGTSLSAENFLPVGSGYTLPYVVLDYDGDGFDDVLIKNTTSNIWYVVRSTGSSFEAPSPTGISGASATELTVTDVDGNGLADFVYGVNGTLRYRTHPGAVSDLLLTATDGFGAAANFAYVPLTQSNYTKLSDAAFPEQDYLGPMYVVNTLTASTGVSSPSTFTQSFWYSGARWHLQGRGFEGFYSKRTLDSRTGLYLSQYFRRDFPYTGMPVQTDVLQADNATLISRSQDTPAYTNSGAGFEQRYFPYSRSTTIDRYEYGGSRNASPVSRLNISTVFDSYGNPQQITTSTQDKDSLSPGYNQTYTSVTTRTITNDTTNWCLGRPTQITTQNILPSAATSIRTQSATIDYAACRVTQQVTEPSSATLKTTIGYGFDTCGNTNSVSVTGTKPDGAAMPTRTTTANYGARCQFPETQTNALSQLATFTYDYSLGAQTSVTDPNGVQTTFQYDAFGRKTRENRPDGTYVVWAYYDCPNWGGCVVGGHGLSVPQYFYNTDNSIRSDGSSYYDIFDRHLMTNERSLASGSYVRRDVRYNVLGEVEKASSPCAWVSNSTDCAFWTVYGYDALGRRIQASRAVSDSDLTVQTTTTHYEALTTRSVDPQGKQTTTVSTVMGQTARSADHDGYAQLFSYDPFGNIAQVQDSSGNTLLSNQWNILGVRIGSTDIDMGTWTYTPNSLGEVLSQTDANSKTTTFTYDALSRPLTRVEPDGSATVTYTYNWGATAAAHNIGKMEWSKITGTSVLDVQQSFAYDASGRLIQTKYTDVEAATDYLVDQSYGAVTGLMDSLTYPTSTSGYRLKLKYEYQNGILSRISDFNAPSTAFWTANAIDPFGHVTDEALGNGLRTVRSFDGMTGWIDYIQTGPGGGASIQNLSYLSDRMGNLIQRQDNRQTLTENFYYDNEYRLDYSTLNGSTNLDLTYNSLGNITDKTGVGAYGYHPSKIHAVTTLAGEPSYQYDANGNGVGEPGVFTFSHYTSGLPKTANWVAEGYSSAFQLGPDGQRFRQTAAYPGGSDSITYIGELVHKEVSASITSWKHYIFAPTGRVALYVRKSSGTPAAATYFFTRDHLGSIDSITDATGAVQVRLSYDAFGVRRNEAGWSGAVPNADWNQIYAITHRGFTDHEMLDDIDVIHMNGRLFDPDSGRFVSSDPNIPDAGSTQSFNRYSYIQNNPLSGIDPTGFEDTSEHRNAKDQNPHPGRSSGNNTWDFATRWGNSLDVKCIGDCRWNGVVFTYENSEIFLSNERIAAIKLRTAQREAADRAMTHFGGPHVELEFNGGLKCCAYYPDEPGLVSSFVGVDDLFSTATSAGLGAIGCQSEGCQLAAAVILAGRVRVNVVPRTVARVIPGTGPFEKLGVRGDDVFVTAAEDIAGMTAEQISQRLAINPSSVYTVIEFPTPMNVASPVFRQNDFGAFLQGGFTRGGAREFVVPNGPIPPGSTTRVVGQ